MVSGDEPAVVELFRSEELAHRGRTDFELEILRDQILANSSFDAERDLVLVEAGGRLIGAAGLVLRTAFVVLAPDVEGPKLRAELITWTERRQAELGRRPYRLGAFSAHAPAIEAIAGAGYEPERVYSLMVRRFDETGPPEPADLAPGYRIRPVDREADAEALHALHERAFAERDDHHPEAIEDYISSLLAFSQFEPAWSLLVEAPEGQPAATLIGWRPLDHPHGYVAVLATDPDHRRHGLGQALLLTAFEEIHAQGLPSAELNVASDNPGALGLYTGVGMREAERFEHHIRTP